MPEIEFWRCTPRKLNALLKVHAKINGADEDDVQPTSKNRANYIDQVLPFF